LLRGFQLIASPGIRRWAALPLLINLVLFGGLGLLSFYGIENLMARVQAWLPGWLSWLQWLLWPLLLVAMLAAVFLLCALLASLISAPFNGPLAKAVALRLTGKTMEIPQRGLAGEVLNSLRQELRRVAYYLSRALPLLLLSLLPGLNLLAAPLWLLFGAWMLALEYSSYALENQGLDFAAQRRRLAQNRAASLGFGFAAMGAAMIPGVNLLLTPAAVAGATALWTEQK
jgi:CysZ protein